MICHIAFKLRVKVSEKNIFRRHIGEFLKIALFICGVILLGLEDKQQAHHIYKYQNTTAGINEGVFLVQLYPLPFLLFAA